MQQITYFCDRCGKEIKDLKAYNDGAFMEA